MENYKTIDFYSDGNEKLVLYHTGLSYVVAKKPYAAKEFEPLYVSQLKLNAKNRFDEETTRMQENPFSVDSLIDKLLEEYANV